MPNITIDLTSQPTISNPSIDLTYLTNGFSFTNGALTSKTITHNELTYSYIKFNAIAGTVSVTMGVSSESNYDFMSLNVSTSTITPSRNGGNMKNISGSVSDTTYTYTISSAGWYYLYFWYAKDGSQNTNNDNGWLKKVILPVLETKQIYLNVNGVWKPVTPYVNVNGVWKEATPSLNVNGTWK